MPSPPPPSTTVPSNFYATASFLENYDAGQFSTVEQVNATVGNGLDEEYVAHTYHPTVFIYGFGFLLIPTATILGNLLVIMSVLRFKALHSAINFLILGLAVADLCVALFVMPYAVYVYVQGGYWYLGNLMCDIYSACDVACSTASILLLAVISFDRYRAVSRPIQYSRQSQNIRRVIVIIIVIWIISLALASPIVLGINNRPDDESEHQCRFYNPEFSIMSSIVSFVIPCFVVLFVYIRIMMALRKREKAARMRRQANEKAQIEKGANQDSDEAGEIVAGPDDHDLGGGSTTHSSTSSLSENLNVVANDFVSEGMTSVSRRSSECDSFYNNTYSTNYFDRAGKPRGHKNHVLPSTTAAIQKRSCPIPRTVGDSVRSRASSCDRGDAILPFIFRTISKKSPKLFRSGKRNNQIKDRVSLTDEAQNLVGGGEGGDEGRGVVAPAKRRTVQDVVNEEELDVLVPPSLTETETMSTNFGLSTPSAASTFKLPDRGDSMPAFNEQAIVKRTPLRDSFKNSEKGINQCPTPRSSPTSSAGDHMPYVDTMPSRPRPQLAESFDGVIENESAAEHPTPLHTRVRTIQSRDEVYTSPSVTFNIAGQKFGTGGGQPEKRDPAQRRRSSVHEVWTTTTNTQDGSAAAGASVSSQGMSMSVSSNVIQSDGTTSTRLKTPVQKTHSRPSKHSIDTIDDQSICSSSTKPSSKTTKKYMSQQKLNGSPSGLAVRIVKRTMHKKDSSLKRKVTKSQRKERRATKTLGIVVGIFLICWVPFFTINILSAVCQKLDIPSCEVGFGPFFYTTWIGYMNSFMNPVIYTIFNTEFRRAFKSIILGRSAAHHQRARQV